MCVCVCIVVCYIITIVITIACNVLYLKIDRDNITKTTTILEIVSSVGCSVFV